MATLAADKPRIFENGFEQWTNEVPVIASDIIYAGAAVGELNDTGTYQPLATGSTIDKFAGFALAKADNSAGAASAINVKIREQGRIRVAVTGASAVTDVGKDVYMTDDDTFSLTASGVVIGKVARWVSGTTCIVEFQAFRLRQSVMVTYSGQTTEAATDRTFFVATRPYYVKAVSQVHSVAAGGASTLQVVKDTSTDAPGAGTDLLSSAFDLNATANTVQSGSLATTAGLRKLAPGNRLAIDFANTIQSTAGLQVTVELIPL